jgi:uncharacterized protein YbaR (Trm112 family)
MDIKNQLDVLRMHLKHDFRGHLSDKSSCIQHCIKYALAERTCSDHEHTKSCSSCDLAYTVSDQIPEVLNTLHNIDETIKEELDYDFKSSQEKIISWRNHCIRTVNQDSCKAKIIKD